MPSEMSKELDTLTWVLGRCNTPHNGEVFSEMLLKGTQKPDDVGCEN